MRISVYVSSNTINHFCMLRTSEVVQCHLSNLSVLSSFSSQLYILLLEAQFNFTQNLQIRHFFFIINSTQNLRRQVPDAIKQQYVECCGLVGKQHCRQWLDPIHHNAGRCNGFFAVSPPYLPDSEEEKARERNDDQFRSSQEKQTFPQVQHDLLT